MLIKEPQELIESCTERKLFGYNDAVMVSIVFDILVME